MRCADTEGSFMVERVVEIADACIRHLKKLANNNGTAAQKDAVSTHLTPPHPAPPHLTPPTCAQQHLPAHAVHVHACLSEGDTDVPSVKFLGVKHCARHPVACEKSNWLVIRSSCVSHHRH